MSEHFCVCNREWHTEGTGLLACDLASGHEGDHLARYDGLVFTSPDLDHLDDSGTDFGDLNDH